MADASATSATSLLEGWEARRSAASGRTWYFHAATKKKTWTRPVAETESPGAGLVACDAAASEKHWADVTAVFAAATIIPAKEREQAWRLLETAASAKSMRVRIVALQTQARLLEEEEKVEIRQFWNEQQEEAEAEVVKAGAKVLEALAMAEKAWEEWERALKRENDISSRLIDAPKKSKSLFSCFARNRGTGK
jgi:hypothetical protein